MSDYRRAFVPRGCWFFTVNLLDRRKALLVEQVEILREAVAATRVSHPFAINAFVQSRQAPQRFATGPLVVSP